MSIMQKYLYKVKEESDINQHLPTLRQYATGLNHVTEMGVRNVVSTWALLAARVPQLVSYDKEYSDNIVEALQLSKDEGLNFKYIVQDVLTVDIDPTDMLFIDTWHTYGQLKKELELHAPKVSKYILLHDTETFGVVGEGGEDKGLQPAIDEFLAANEMWYLKEKFTNNNGLTVLAKYEI